MSHCTMPDCENQAQSRGLCPKHYAERRRQMIESGEWNPPKGDRCHVQVHVDRKVWEAAGELAKARKLTKTELIDKMIRALAKRDKLEI